MAKFLGGERARLQNSAKMGKVPLTRAHAPNILRPYYKMPINLPDLWGAFGAPLQHHAAHTASRVQVPLKMIVNGVPRARRGQHTAARRARPCCTRWGHARVSSVCNIEARTLSPAIRERSGGESSAARAAAPLYLLDGARVLRALKSVEQAHTLSAGCLCACCECSGAFVCLMLMMVWRIFRGFGVKGMFSPC